MSLRWRLMLSVGAVVLTSLAAVAYISSRVVRVELKQLTHMTGPVSPQARRDAAQAVAARYHEHRLEGMEGVLTRIRMQNFPQSELILLDPQRRLLASSAPLGENVEVSDGSNGATLVTFGKGARRSELLVRGGAMEIVVEDHGVIGSLMVVPRWDRTPRDPMRDVNRWLLVAVAGVGAASLLFTALVAHRVIAPIERLQEATARLRGGFLEERVAVTSRDEVGQLAEAFNAMTGRLQQHEQLRRNMVNDVAHELRTPLTNLRASIEAIQDGLRAPDRHVIDALHDDVLLLQRLVEDLQTLALAEAGKLPLHIEDIDLREELERFTAAQSDSRLHVRVDPGLRLPADHVRLQQILSNLVRNAIAHTDVSGRVEIAATAHSDTIIRLTVADDGRGIPAADLPYVFDRFYRTDISRTRSTGGAGLGLAIVRELVEIHGGRIDVESDERHGTRFTIDLPRVRAEIDVRGTEG